MRQWRHGVKEFTLEIPGGLVDAGETPAAVAPADEPAADEVLEESGEEGTE